MIFILNHFLLTLCGKIITIILLSHYSGAAHGLSAILQMLLSFPEFYKSDVSIEGDIRASVDFMLSIMQPNGNIAPAVDELGQGGRPESEELLHWCHGAPGKLLILFMLLGANLVNTK